MPILYFAGIAGVYFYGRYVERGELLSDTLTGDTMTGASNLANVILAGGAIYAIYKGLK